MRKRQVLIASLAACLLTTMSVGFVSCKDDKEEAPVIVENPLDKEAYYIMGKVTQGTTALEGVTVSTSGSEAKSGADGSFQLEVTKKGDYSVSFAKEGYITVSADVTIAASEKKRSSVALTQELTKANAPVNVKPDEAATVSGGEKSGTSLQIPAGAVKTATDITVTEFTPGAKKASVAGLSTLSCQPDGLTFEKPVKVEVKNLTTSVIYFANVGHYVEKSGLWTKVGDAAYEAAKNVYTVELTGFSNHSFGPSYTASATGTASEDLGEVVIDNLGKRETTEGDVVGKQKFGWQIDGDLTTLLKAQFPALSAADIEGLSTAIQKSIASVKGSSAGVGEAAFSMGKAKVSGDTKMTVKFSASVKKTSGAFSFVYQNKPATFHVPVKNYAGVKTEISYTLGSSHTGHSGGSGK